MKRRLLLVFLLISTSAFAGTCGNGYTNSRQLFANFTLVPNTDQTNFPVPVAFNGASSYGSIPLPGLKTVANGGQIQNTANNSRSVSGPADLIFCDAASAGNPLKYETVSYDAPSGALEGYVKIPTLSHTAHTPYWIFWGNSGVVTSQQDLSLWPDAFFVQACHLPNGSSLSVVCSVGGTQTNHGATANAGVLNGGANFVAASSQWIDVGGANNTGTGIVTVESWMKPASTGAGLAIMDNIDGPVNGYSLRYDVTGGGEGLIATCTSGSCFQRLTSNVISTGQWTYLAGTYSAPTMNIYINGILNNGSTIGSSAGLAASGSNLRLGSWAAGSHFYDGSADETRVSSVARSADWLSTTYNSFAAPSAFSSMIDPSLTGARVVQSTVCRGASPVPCVLPQTVVSGSTLIIVSNTGEHACTTGDYSDTRSSTFTLHVGTSNLGIGDANSCILSAPLGSSGAETVTYTSVGDSGGMIVYEIAGMSSPSLDVSNLTSAPATTITTPSVTASTANSLLICGSGIKPAAATLVQAFSPSTSAALAINNFNAANSVGGSGILQFTGSGSKSCSFTFGSSPAHGAATIAVIKYSPVSLTQRIRTQVF